MVLSNQVYSEEDSFTPFARQKYPWLPDFTEDVRMNKLEHETTENVGDEQNLLSVGQNSSAVGLTRPLAAREPERYGMRFGLNF